MVERTSRASAVKASKFSKQLNWNISAAFAQLVRLECGIDDAVIPIMVTGNGPGIQHIAAITFSNVLYLFFALMA
ncbi:hypothetical protein [Paenibacillus gorillae]|uniref:hypothetical protein n=1 Tax=Paenibacillus gorillae TaxID=1243662 RepID=UPI0012DF7DCB|nr:hypothetical protein [Paenibacillus gorillae]